MSRKTGITLTYRELRMSKLSRNTRPPPCGKELNVMQLCYSISIIYIDGHNYLGIYGSDGVFWTEKSAHIVSKGSLVVHGKLGRLNTIF